MAMCAIYVIFLKKNSKNKKNKGYGLYRYIHTYIHTVTLKKNSATTKKIKN